MCRRRCATKSIKKMSCQKNCVGDHVTDSNSSIGGGGGGGGDLGGVSLFIQLMNQKAENGCCTLGPSDRARRVIYEFTGHEDNADLKSVNIYLYGSDGVQ